MNPRENLISAAATRKQIEVMYWTARRIKIVDANNAFIEAKHTDLDTAPQRETAFDLIKRLEEKCSQAESMDAKILELGGMTSQDAEIYRDLHIDLSTEVFYIFGFLHALGMVATANARRAANGRRKIGNLSMERVRAAAVQHFHQTKFDAAVDIAPKVGLSAGRVQKMLTALFPGDSWGASSDATSRNG